jgi:hypothetical protein
MRFVALLLVWLLFAGAGAQVANVEVARELSDKLNWEWSEQRVVDTSKNDQGDTVTSLGWEVSGQTMTVWFSSDDRPFMAARSRASYGEPESEWVLTSREQVVKLAEKYRDSLGYSGFRVASVRMANDPSVKRTFAYGISTVSFSDAPGSTKVASEAGNALIIDFEASNGRVKSVWLSHGWSYGPDRASLAPEQVKDSAIRFLTSCGIDDIDAKKLEVKTDPAYAYMGGSGSETPAGQSYRTSRETRLVYSLFYDSRIALSVDANTGEVLMAFAVGANGTSPELQSREDAAKISSGVSRRPWHLPAKVGAGVVGISLVGWGIHRRRKVKASTPAP